MKQGNLPMPYLTSVLDVYELVLHKSPNYNGNMAYKLKQEILHGLGKSFMYYNWHYSIKRHFGVLSSD